MQQPYKANHHLVLQVGEQVMNTLVVEGGVRKLLKFFKIRLSLHNLMHELISRAALAYFYHGKS